jgi:hypothetical protein
MFHSGQTRRFKSLPATSGLPPSTDIIRPVRLVRLVQEAKDRENRKCNIAKRQSSFPAAQTTMEKCPSGKSVRFSNCGLSSPADKNIPLNTSGKSPLQARPVPPG